MNAAYKAYFESAKLLLYLPSVGGVFTVIQPVSHDTGRVI